MFYSRSSSSCRVEEYSLIFFQVNREDFEMVDYLNELRESCLEGYTGIVQGLRGDAPSASTINPPGANGDTPGQQNGICNELIAMQSQIPNMIKFILDIGQDEDRNDSLVAAACGLIGDLIAAYGSRIVTLFEQEKVIKDLLTEGRKSKQQKTKTLACWASKEMKSCLKLI